MGVGIGVAIGFYVAEPKSQISKPSPELTYSAAYTNTTNNEIIVTSPSPGEGITSPFLITGQARGSWFFEATAPFDLVDWDGLIIASGYVTASGDWMTDDFVDFSGIVEFVAPTYKNNGALILRADNPSGLPEHDRAVEIPIFFQK